MNLNVGLSNGASPDGDDLLVILPHDDQLLSVAGTKVRQNGEVVEARGPLLVVDEGLGEVDLLLNQPLGVDQQLLQG